MDLVTMEHLTTLLNTTGWCVSLFMPAHRTGRETEQDPIRFKNLMREAEERLEGKGLRTPEVSAVIKPMRDLLQDQGFWRQQSDGLAVFASKDGLRSYRVPLQFEELVVVSDRFHLKPILPMAISDAHFYILALSQNRVRLLEGTRFTVDEIQVDDLPESLIETVYYETHEKQLNVRSVSAGGSGGRTGIFHGHDAGDEQRTQILRWFHQIDSALQPVLGSAESPLVLTGVEWLIPLYREANSYADLLDSTISGNPDDLRPEELHARVWELVHPHFLRAQERTIDRYRQLIGTGRTTSEVADAVLAAAHGRIEALIVPIGVQIWGRADIETDRVDVHDRHEPGDTDLLDLAAIQSLLNGGRVYAVAPDSVPNGAVLAAILRY